MNFSYILLLPTTFLDLPSYLSCVLFCLVTQVQSRTSLQYSIAAVVVVYVITVVATKLYAKTKKSRVKVGNEDVLAEFFTPRKHENNVVLTHFLFQIPRTFKLSVKIGLQSKKGSLKGQIQPYFEY